MTSTSVRTILLLALTSAFLGLSACGSSGGGDNGFQSSDQLQQERDRGETDAQRRAQEAADEAARRDAEAEAAVDADARARAEEAARLAREAQAIATAEISFRDAGKCADVPGRMPFATGASITTVADCYPVIRITCASNAAAPESFDALVYYKSDGTSRPFSFLKKDALTTNMRSWNAAPVVAQPSVADERTNTFNGDDLVGGKLSASVAVDYELFRVVYHDGSVDAIETRCTRAATQ